MTVDRRSARRVAFWVLATAGLVAAWWIAQLLAPGRRATVLTGDLRIYYYPVYDAFYRRLAAGDLPVWNPYHLCGLPWLALLSGGFFYPPHVLYLLLPTHHALAASALAHLLLIALSTALFVRRAGGTAAAAVLAALLFTLRGALPAQLPQPLLLEGVAWLPLGAGAVLDLARGGGRRAVALLAAAMGASLLSGALQMTIFLLYAWGTLFVALLLGARAAPIPMAARALRFAAALGLGALAAAVQLLPTRELTRIGTRATRSLDVTKMFPVGLPGFGLVRQALSGTTSSFGVLGLALVPAAVVAGRPRAVAFWALGFGGLAFIFAMGPVTPLFDLYLALPFLPWFRTPQRILVLTDFCFAVLAALGLDAVAGAAGAGDTGAARPVPRRIALLASLGCALAMAGNLAAQGAAAAASLAAAAAAALLVGGWGRGRSRAFPLRIALLMLAIPELFRPPPQPEHFPYDATAAAWYEQYRKTYATLAEAQGSDRVWVLSSGLAATLGPKQPSRFRVRAIDDYESLNLHRQAEYFTYAQYGTTDPAAITTTYVGRLVPLRAADGRSVLARHRRLLDLAALRLVAIHDVTLAHPEVQAFVAQAGLTPRPSPGPRLALFENPHALPRAFVAYRTRPAPPPGELLRRLSDPAFDPLVETYVEGDPGFVAASDAPARGEAATFVRDEERVVELDAHLAAPGLVVLADSFYPGWRATVDGAPAPILAANHLFRGVPAPAGRHRVRFEYQPRRALAGAAVSVLAAAVIAGLWLSGRGGRG